MNKLYKADTVRKMMEDTDAIVHNYVIEHIAPSINQAALNGLYSVEITVYGLYAHGLEDEVADYVMGCGYEVTWYPEGDDAVFYIEWSHDYA